MYDVSSIDALFDASRSLVRKTQISQSFLSNIASFAKAFEYCVAILEILD